MTKGDKEVNEDLQMIEELNGCKVESGIPSTKKGNHLSGNFHPTSYGFAADALRSVIEEASSRALCSSI